MCEAFFRLKAVLTLSPGALQVLMHSSSPLRSGAMQPPRPRRRANRDAHLLIPPLRLMKSRSGSSRSLYSAAYRNTRDHLATCPVIDLVAICRAKDHSRELTLGIRLFHVANDGLPRWGIRDFHYAYIDIGLLQF